MSKITYLRYSMEGALREGLFMHAKDVIEKLGMTIKGWEGCQSADCIFIAVTNAPEALPSFITITDRGCELYDGYDMERPISKENKVLAEQAWDLLKKGFSK